MSVKKEPSGRRSIQLEVEVPGTPEEVWQAIATGPGISSWLVPAQFEMQGARPVALKLSFGPGMEPTSAITEWNPPLKWTSQADGWAPGSPPIATEWTIETRARGTCVVRIVQSLFATTDDWDNQLEGAEYGWPGFLRTLRLYLTHFRNQRSTVMKWMLPVPGSEAQAWDALTAALGLRAVTTGQRWTSPPGVPAFSGVVEYLTHSPYDALLRIDTPGPGIAALGAINCGGPSMVALNVYLYGDHAPATAARETPRWDAWFHQHFPPPSQPT